MNKLKHPKPTIEFPLWYWKFNLFGNVPEWRS